MKTFKDMQDSRQLAKNINDDSDSDWCFTYFGGNFYIEIPDRGGSFHLQLMNNGYVSHKLEELERVLWNEFAEGETNSISTYDVKDMLLKVLGIDCRLQSDFEIRTIVKSIPIGHRLFAADEMILLKRWLG